VYRQLNRPPLILLLRNAEQSINLVRIIILHNPLNNPPKRALGISRPPQDEVGDDLLVFGRVKVEDNVRRVDADRDERLGALSKLRDRIGGGRCGGLPGDVRCETRVMSARSLKDAMMDGWTQWR
jgi:hypothetical protein